LVLLGLERPLQGASFFVPGRLSAHQHSVSSRQWQGSWVALAFELGPPEPEPASAVAPPEPAFVPELAFVPQPVFVPQPAVVEQQKLVVVSWTELL